jgi:hypothetical protein
MKTKSYIALSGIVSLLLVIASIVGFVNYLHNTYMEIFHIGHLIDNNFCSAIDEGGKEYIDPENGSIYGKDNLYSKEYCAFHPLMLTDEKFRESALTLYGGLGGLFSAFMKLYNREIELPDVTLPSKDPVLANMILNPWYSSDTAFFTNVFVDYTLDLKTFIIDYKRYNIKYDDKSGEEGLFLSWAKTRMNYNEEKLRECKSNEKAECVDHPASCPCKNMDVNVYYLYTSNDNIIELPMRLYMGKVDEKDAKTIKIKKGGKATDKVIQPLKVKTVQDLERTLMENFFGFKKSVGKECEGITLKTQKAYDSKCKFFGSDALEGLVTALRRIIVINISNEAALGYKEKVDKIISLNKTLNYLQFFLWLAIRSQYEKLTFTFRPFKPK